MKHAFVWLAVLAAAGLAACDREPEPAVVTPPTVVVPDPRSPDSRPGPIGSTNDPTVPGAPGIAGDSGDMGSTGGSGSLGRPPPPPLGESVSPGYPAGTPSDTTR